MRATSETGIVAMGLLLCKFCLYNDVKDEQGYGIDPAFLACGRGNIELAGYLDNVYRSICEDFVCLILISTGEGHDQKSRNKPEANWNWLAKRTEVVDQSALCSGGCFDYGGSDSLGHFCRG